MATILVACGAEPFECSTDPQCGDGGMCEPIGFCSFADGACESGRRFGGRAASDLAGRCTDDAAASSETAPDDSATAGGSATSGNGGHHPAGASESGGDTWNDGDDGPQTGGSTTDDGGGTAACAESGDCLPEAPPGWNGPWRVTPGDGCDGAMPADLVFSDLTVDGESCVCECESNVDCAYPDIYLPDNGCTTNNPVSLGELAVDTCFAIDLSTVAPNITAAVEWAGQDDAECQAVGGPTLPAADFEETWSLCALPDDACEHGTCPEPDVEICILSEGAHECPGVDYTRREIRYREIDDARTCDACECAYEDPSSVCQIELHGTNACGMEVATLDAQPGLACETFGTLPAVYSIVSKATACAPAQSWATGDVSPAEPTTLCCLPS
ncbi:MAG: hypothetical protein AAF721_17520 [Myxococcota bacterium]